MGWKKIGRGCLGAAHRRVLSQGGHRLMVDVPQHVGVLLQPGEARDELVGGAAGERAVERAAGHLAQPRRPHARLRVLARPRLVELHRRSAAGCGGRHGAKQ